MDTKEWTKGYWAGLHGFPTEVVEGTFRRGWECGAAARMKARSDQDILDRRSSGRIVTNTADLAGTTTAGPSQ